jgi:hypothetical protein
MPGTIRAGGRRLRHGCDSLTGCHRTLRHGALVDRAGSGRAKALSPRQSDLKRLGVPIHILHHAEAALAQKTSLIYTLGCTGACLESEGRDGKDDAEG